MSYMPFDSLSVIAPSIVNYLAGDFVLFCRFYQVKEIFLSFVGFEATLKITQAISESINHQAPVCEIMRVMKAYAFIDASNLFYGGVKSLGWKIDYERLKEYLIKKYKVSKIFYFGGVELHGFNYDYIKNDTIPLNKLEKYLEVLLNRKGLSKSKKQVLLMHFQRIKFYKKLESFGYKLYLKPVKFYREINGSLRKKANCDVDMAFHLMKEKDNFDNVVILSGDGDFLPVLKYLKKTGKKVTILARGERTAKEIKQFAGGDFRDFVKLEKEIKFAVK